MAEKIRQAVILAAGEGQRLRPFTALKPKVMIRVAHKPILQYVVEALARNGIFDITIIVGYRKEQVMDFFGSGEQFGVRINYLRQEQQLGTAHALKQAKELAEESFLVLSGDNIIEPDTITQIVGAKTNAILIKDQEDVSKYGVVEVRGGRVTDIVEKPKEAGSHLVNTGIYAFTREIFRFIEQEVDLPAVLKDMITQGYDIIAQKAQGTWLDAVFPWDILRLNDIALQRMTPSLGGTIENGVTVKGLVCVGEGTIIRANSYIVGPVIIGESCEIGPSVCVLPSTSIGDNVVISPFTQIKNSVINNNVEVGASSIIEDSVIDQGSIFKGHFTALSGEAEVEIEGEYHKPVCGAMIGEYCHIEDSVVTYPGVILGNHCRVKAMKQLQGKIPEGSLVM